MNHLVYFKLLKADIAYKVSDRSKGFNVRPILSRNIRIKQYECKKNIKGVGTKKVQQFILTTVQDQSFLFFSLKQLNTIKPEEVYTLADRQFLQSDLFSSMLGQISQKSSDQYQVTGFTWDGFVLQFVTYSEDYFLVIITNELVSPTLKNLSSKDLPTKIKISFEEIISRIISEKKAPELIQIYLQELKRLFERHRQLVTETQEERRINFNLIKYGKICDTSTDVKSRIISQRKQPSPPKMEIQN